MGINGRLREFFLRNYMRFILRSKSKIATWVSGKILRTVLQAGFFDREKYVAVRGKDLMEGVNPEIHALIWGARRGFEGLYSESEVDTQNRDRQYAQTLEKDLGLEFAKKIMGIPADLPLVVMVTHDLSRTGAPILALNLVAELTKKFFVISVSLGGGELKDNFDSLSGSHFALHGREEDFPALLDKISKVNKPRAVFLNSIVSSPCVEAVNKAEITSILLIHEFLAYSEVTSRTRDAIHKASIIVFSSNVVLRDYEQSRLLDKGALKNSVVIHQGISAVPQHVDYRKSVDYNFQEKIDYLLSSTKLDTPQLVIGVGTVQHRKGVDLFIEVARQIRLKPGLEDTVFAWIGGGYNPFDDYGYSVYLNDQIYRSSLRRHLRILESSSSYGYAIDRCSVFCLTSRLDPLPNVALDAIAEGKPISYFDQASGLSELFDGFSALKSGEVPYLDVTQMADNVAEFLRMSKDEKFSKTSEEIKRFAVERLSFEQYASKLVALI
jgi:glycosyltransferase involved in cell wall biosynthesis